LRRWLRTAYECVSSQSSAGLLAPHALLPAQIRTSITDIVLTGRFCPMAVAEIGVAVSLGFMREPTHKISIWGEVGGGAPSLVPNQP